jgi:hypothetical protein
VPAGPGECRAGTRTDWTTLPQAADACADKRRYVVLWTLGSFGRVYRSIWYPIALVLAVPGVVACCVVWGTSVELIPIWLFAGLAVAGGWALAAQPRAVTLRMPPFVVGFLCGVAVLTIVGLGTLFGPVGVLVALLVSVAGWPALPRRLPPPDWRPAGGWTFRGGAPERHEGGTRSPVATAPVVEPVLPPLSALTSMSTPEVCWGWRTTYALLQQSAWAEEPTKREKLAQLRAGYLDELQRRDPAAFDRWFPSARAASDPGRFFYGPHT